MKNFILILFSIIALNSCDSKGIGVSSNDCDTIVQINHDTIFIDKPIYITDTIYKVDTIYKTAIERDTIIKVDTLRVTDTIIRTEFVQKWDTVFVPKIDTVLIDKIVRDTILINKVDTVEVIKPLPNYTKDTLVWGFSRIKLNKPRQLVFTYKLNDTLYESFNIKTLDTTIYKCGVSQPIMKKDSLQFNIRKFYEGNYLVKAEEIEKPIDTTFRIVELAIREQDAENTYLQMYVSEPWNWASRRSNTLENLGDFIEVDYEHGNPENYTASDGITYPILYRNSNNFDTRFFEIRATNKVTGQQITTGIIENKNMQ